LKKPSIEDAPDGRGVLVRVLKVGVDGTGKEIKAADMVLLRNDMSSS